MKLETIAKLLLGGAALALLFNIRHERRHANENTGEAVLTDAEESVQEDSAGEDTAQTETCRAEILEARREMDPVTLQGWSRVTFRCEDGEERKMYFPGENGIYLLKGETGMLEHRDGAFVSFEKDSGEIVGALYHIPADGTEE